MKKIWGIVGILLGIALSTMSATEKKITFSITPKIGFSAGQIKENLYNSVSEKLVSELDWKKFSLLNSGFDSELKIKKINFSFSAVYNMPFKCGQMTDSDFYSSGVKQKYSVFTNYADYKNFALDFKFYYDFLINDFFTISPLVQADYRHYSFYTSLGKGWYGYNGKPWNDESAEEHPKLSHIEYLQQSYFLFTGAKFTFNYKKIKSSLSAGISPFTLNYSIDYHADDSSNSTKKDFSTYSKQTASFKSFIIDFDFEYFITQKVHLYTNVNFLILNEIKGPTGIQEKSRPDEKFAFTEDTEKWNITGQMTGNSIFEFYFFAGCKILF
jgi:hypothetical protein